MLGPALGSNKKRHFDRSRNWAEEIQISASWYSTFGEIITAKHFSVTHSIEAISVSSRNKQSGFQYVDALGNNRRLLAGLHMTLGSKMPPLNSCCSFCFLYIIISQDVFTLNTVDVLTLTSVDAFGRISVDGFALISVDGMQQHTQKISQVNRSLHEGWIRQALCTGRAWYRAVLQ